MALWRRSLLFKIEFGAFWGEGMLSGAKPVYGLKRKDFDPKSPCSFLAESFFLPEKITLWVKKFMQFFSSKIFVVLVTSSLLHLHSNIPKMLQKS
jgi:hypothetical protein